MADLGPEARVHASLPCLVPPNIQNGYRFIKINAFSANTTFTQSSSWTQSAVSQHLAVHGCASPRPLSPIPAPSHPPRTAHTHTHAALGPGKDFMKFIVKFVVWPKGVKFQ